MQVKKFEAPTIQEALDTIKRELGPEAIILQTKKYKRGFGLMSKASVEITAAISDRSVQKKAYVEKRLSSGSRDTLKNIGAGRQADIIDDYVDKHASKAAANAYERAQPKAHSSSGASHLDRLTQTADRVEVRRSAPSSAAVSGGQIGAAVVQSGRKVTSTRYIDIQDEAGKSGTPGMSVQDEIRHLKRMLEEVKGNQESRDSRSHQTGSGAHSLMAAGTLEYPAMQDAYEQLVINGMDKRNALSLLKKVGFELGTDQARQPEAVLDQLALEVLESTQIASPLLGVEPGKGAGPAVITLVGPTGVGKTTTIAKIASEALIKKNLKVGLINLDSYKIAAFDQLATYAKILNVPFRSVANAQDLQSALADFKSLDLVLIDTTGRSQKDPEALKQMQAILSVVPSNNTQLVLSATTRDGELYDIASRFGIFKPQAMVISKLDEATTFGSIYNISQKAKLPLSYFTTGQRVPEDIEQASRERLVSLVLEI